MAKWRARLRRLSPREADSTEPHEPTTAYVIRGGPRPGDSRAHNVRLFGVWISHIIYKFEEGSAPPDSVLQCAGDTPTPRALAARALALGSVLSSRETGATGVYGACTVCGRRAASRVLSEQYEHSVPDAAHAGTAAPLCHRRPDPPPPSSRPRLTSQPNQLVS